MSNTERYVYLQSGVHKCRGRFSALASTRRQRLRTVFGNCQHPSATPADGFRQLPGPVGNACGRFSATASTRRQRLRTGFGTCQHPSATGPDRFRHLPKVVRNAARVVIWPLNRVTYVGENAKGWQGQAQESVQEADDEGVVPRPPRGVHLALRSKLDATIRGRLDSPMSRTLPATLILTSLFATSPAAAQAGGTPAPQAQAHWPRLRELVATAELEERHGEPRRTPMTLDRRLSCRDWIHL